MQRIGRMSVVEPLQLLRVTQYGRRLRLLVLDSRRRHQIISFRFATGAVADLHRERMRDWTHERTRLAYVRGGSESVLLDIDSLLARAQ
jgi:hypothetical protein